MGHQQSSIFEFLYDEYKITKPIRLIELFSGIGAQAKALEVLGANFESWKTCDWAVPSIHAYASIHGTFKGASTFVAKTKEEKIDLFLNGVSANYNVPMTKTQLMKKSDSWIDDLLSSILGTNNLIDIMQVDEGALEIRHRDLFTYVMTYSFPCQDLSLAGNKKGMSVSQADGGTRSGLLWEVERILLECHKSATLPHVLIMENVPEVVGVKNIKDFQKWRARLESFGYSNYCEILNAKDYGIPQNRRRCFMVSILGEYSFTFPRRMPTRYNLKDFLETEVDEKYYISQKMFDYLTGVNQKESKYDRGEVFGRNLNPDKKVAATITTRAGMRPTDNFIVNEDALNDNPKINLKKVVDEDSAGLLGSINGHQSGNVYSDNGLSPTLTACDYKSPPKILIKNKSITETLESNDISDIKDVAFLDGFNRKIKKDGLSKTITTRVSASNNDFLIIKNATKEGYLSAEDGDGVDISTRMHHHRGTVQKQSCQTITTMGGENVGVVVNLKGELCDKLIQEGRVQEGDVVRHSYSSSRMKDLDDSKQQRLESQEGLSPTLTTRPDTLGVTVNDELYSSLRIRKLLPLECMKLMGFEEKDYLALRDIGQTDAQIYHEAGDSIVTTVLMAIFGQLLGIDYEPIIEKYVDSLVSCNSGCKVQ